MARRRGFPVQSRTQRRVTSWGQGPEDTGTTLTATGAAVWTSGVALNLESKATIVRTRGLITFGIVGAAGADGDRMCGAAGIGIVSTDAFAAGATPDAVSDATWPGWLWYAHWDVSDGDIDRDNGAVSRYQRIVIDSKAMRKLGQNETVFGSVEAVETGAVSMEFVAQSRILLKLT